MNNKKKWFISLAHAFVLTIISLVWMHTPYTYGDEKFLIKWSAVIKRLVFNYDEAPLKNQFLFINLAHEKALIPLEDQLGNEVITDRLALAKFFSIEKKHPNAAKFTLCDVFLKGKSANDSLLCSSISGVPNVLFPAQLDANDQLEKPQLKVPFAMANYSSTDQGFFKIKLFQGKGYQAIPEVMYEKLQQKKIISNWGLHWDNHKPCFNSIIIDNKIRPENVFQKKEYPVVNLSELLILPEDVIVNDFIKNRIIVMGDFVSDQHQTSFGNIPGTFILLNTYLSLTKGFHIIKWSLMLYLIIALTLYARIVFFNTQNKITESKWLLRFIESVFLLSIISIGSYFLFNIAIQVLVLTVYTSFLLYIRKVKNEKIPIFKLKYWINNYLYPKQE